MNKKQKILTSVAILGVGASALLTNSSINNIESSFISSNINKFNLEEYQAINAAASIVKNESAFKDEIRKSLPNITESKITEYINKLYASFIYKAMSSDYLVDQNRFENETPEQRYQRFSGILTSVDGSDYTKHTIVDQQVSDYVIDYYKNRSTYTILSAVTPTRKHYGYVDYYGPMDTSAILDVVSDGNGGFVLSTLNGKIYSFSPKTNAYTDITSRLTNYTQNSKTDLIGKIKRDNDGNYFLVNGYNYLFGNNIAKDPQNPNYSLDPRTMKHHFSAKAIYKLDKNLNYVGQIDLTSNNNFSGNNKHELSDFLPDNRGGVYIGTQKGEIFWGKYNSNGSEIIFYPMGVGRENENENSARIDFYNNLYGVYNKSIDKMYWIDKNTFAAVNYEKNRTNGNNNAQSFNARANTIIEINDTDGGARSSYSSTQKGLQDKWDTNNSISDILPYYNSTNNSTGTIYVSKNGDYFYGVNKDSENEEVDPNLDAFGKSTFSRSTGTFIEKLLLNDDTGNKFYTKAINLDNNLIMVYGPEGSYAIFNPLEYSKWINMSSSNGTGKEKFNLNTAKIGEKEDKNQTRAQINLPNEVRPESTPYWFDQGIGNWFHEWQMESITHAVPDNNGGVYVFTLTGIMKHYKVVVEKRVDGTNMAYLSDYVESEQEWIKKWNDLYYLKNLESTDSKLNYDLSKYTIDVKSGKTTLAYDLNDPQNNNGIELGYKLVYSLDKQSWYNEIPLQASEINGQNLYVKLVSRDQRFIKEVQTTVKPYKLPKRININNDLTKFDFTFESNNTSVEGAIAKFTIPSRLSKIPEGIKLVAQFTSNNEDSNFNSEIEYTRDNQGILIKNDQLQNQIHFYYRYDTATKKQYIIENNYLIVDKPVIVNADKIKALITANVANPSDSLYREDFTINLAPYNFDEKTNKALAALSVFIVSNDEEPQPYGVLRQGRNTIENNRILTDNNNLNLEYSSSKNLELVIYDFQKNYFVNPFSTLQEIFDRRTSKADYVLINSNYKSDFYLSMYQSTDNNQIVTQLLQDGFINPYWSPTQFTTQYGDKIEFGIISKAVNQEQTSITINYVIKDEKHNLSTTKTVTISNASFKSIKQYAIDKFTNTHTIELSDLTDVLASEDKTQWEAKLKSELKAFLDKQLVQNSYEIKLDENPYTIDDTNGQVIIKFGLKENQVSAFESNAFIFTFTGFQTTEQRHIANADNLLNQAYALTNLEEIIQEAQIKQLLANAKTEIADISEANKKTLESRITQIENYLTVKDKLDTLSHTNFETVEATKFNNDLEEIRTLFNTANLNPIPNTKTGLTSLVDFYGLYNQVLLARDATNNVVATAQNMSEHTAENISLLNDLIIDAETKITQIEANSSVNQYKPEYTEKLKIAKDKLEELKQVKLEEELFNAATQAIEKAEQYNNEHSEDFSAQKNHEFYELVELAKNATAKAKNTTDLETRINKLTKINQARSAMLNVKNAFNNNLANATIKQNISSAKSAVIGMPVGVQKNKFNTKITEFEQKLANIEYVQKTQQLINELKTQAEADNQLVDANLSKEIIDNLNEKQAIIKNRLDHINTFSSTEKARLATENDSVNSIIEQVKNKYVTFSIAELENADWTQLEALFNTKDDQSAKLAEAESRIKVLKTQNATELLPRINKVKTNIELKNDLEAFIIDNQEKNVETLNLKLTLLETKVNEFVENSQFNQYKPTLLKALEQAKKHKQIVELDNAISAANLNANIASVETIEALEQLVNDAQTKLEQAATITNGDVNKATPFDIQTRRDTLKTAQEKLKALKAKKLNDQNLLEATNSLNVLIEANTPANDISKYSIDNLDNIEQKINSIDATLTSDQKEELETKFKQIKQLIEAKKYLRAYDGVFATTPFDETNFDENKKLANQAIDAIENTEYKAGANQIKRNLAQKFYIASAIKETNAVVNYDQSGKDDATISKELDQLISTAKSKINKIFKDKEFATSGPAKIKELEDQLKPFELIVQQKADLAQKISNLLNKYRSLNDQWTTFFNQNAISFDQDSYDSIVALVKQYKTEYNQLNSGDVTTNAPKLPHYVAFYDKYVLDEEQLTKFIAKSIATGKPNITGYEEFKTKLIKADNMDSSPATQSGKLAELINIYKDKILQIIDFPAFIKVNDQEQELKELLKVRPFNFETTKAKFDEYIDSNDYFKAISDSFEANGKTYNSSIKSEDRDVIVEKASNLHKQLYLLDIEEQFKLFAQNQNKDQTQVTQETVDLLKTYTNKITAYFDVTNATYGKYSLKLEKQENTTKLENYKKVIAYLENIIDLNNKVTNSQANTPETIAALTQEINTLEQTLKQYTYEPEQSNYMVTKLETIRTKFEQESAIRTLVNAENNIDSTLTIEQKEALIKNAKDLTNKVKPEQLTDFNSRIKTLKDKIVELKLQKEVNTLLQNLQELNNANKGLDNLDQIESDLVTLKQKIAQSTSADFQRSKAQAIKTLDDIVAAKNSAKAINELNSNNEVTSKQLEDQIADLNSKLTPVDNYDKTLLEAIKTKAESKLVDVKAIEKADELIELALADSQSANPTQDSIAQLETLINNADNQIAQIISNTFTNPKIKSLKTKLEAAKTKIAELKNQKLVQDATNLVQQARDLNDQNLGTLKIQELNNAIKNAQKAVEKLVDPSLNTSKQELEAKIAILNKNLEAKQEVNKASQVSEKPDFTSQELNTAIENSEQKVLNLPESEKALQDSLKIIIEQLKATKDAKVLVENANQAIEEANTAAQTATIDNVEELRTKYNNAIENIEKLPAEDRATYQAKLDTTKQKLAQLDEQIAKNKLYNDAKGAIQQAIDSDNNNLNSQNSVELKTLVANAQEALEAVLNDAERKNELTNLLAPVLSNLDLKETVKAAKDLNIDPINVEKLQTAYEKANNKLTNSASENAQLNTALKAELKAIKYDLDTQKYINEVTALNETLDNLSTNDIDKLTSDIEQLKTKANGLFNETDLSSQLAKLQQAEQKLAALKAQKLAADNLKDATDKVELAQQADLLNEQTNSQRIEDIKQAVQNAQSAVTIANNPADLVEKLNKINKSIALKEAIEAAQQMADTLIIGDLSQNNSEQLLAKINQAEQLILDAQDQQKTSLTNRLNELKTTQQDLVKYEQALKLIENARAISTEPVQQNADDLEALITQIEAIELDQNSPFKTLLNTKLNEAKLKDKLDKLKVDIAYKNKVDSLQTQIDQLIKYNNDNPNDSINDPLERQLNGITKNIQDANLDSNKTDEFSNLLTNVKKSLVAKKAIAQLKTLAANNAVGFNEKLTEVKEKVAELSNADHKTNLEAYVESIVIKNAQRLVTVANSQLQDEANINIEELEKAIQNAEKHIEKVKDDTKRTELTNALKNAKDKLTELKDAADAALSTQKAEQEYNQAIEDVKTNSIEAEANIDQHVANINQYAQKLRDHDQSDVNIAKLENYVAQLENIKAIKNDLTALDTNVSTLSATQLEAQQLAIQTKIDNVENEDAKTKLQADLNKHSNTLLAKKATEAANNALSESQKETPVITNLQKAINKANDAIKLLKEADPNNANLATAKANVASAQAKLEELLKEQNNQELLHTAQNNVEQLIAFDNAHYDNLLDRLETKIADTQASVSLLTDPSLQAQKALLEAKIELVKQNLAAKQALQEAKTKANTDFKAQDLNNLITKARAQYAKLTDPAQSTLAAQINSDLLELEKQYQAKDKLEKAQAAVLEAQQTAQNATTDQIADLEAKIATAKEAIKDVQEDQKLALNNDLKTAEDKLEALKTQKTRDDLFANAEQLVDAAIAEDNAHLDSKNNQALTNAIQLAQTELDKINDDERLSDLQAKLEQVKRNLNAKKAVDNANQKAINPIDVALLEKAILDAKEELTKTPAISGQLKVNLNKELADAQYELAKQKIADNIADLDQSLNNLTTADIAKLTQDIEAIKQQIAQDINDQDKEAWLNKLDQAETKLSNLEKENQANLSLKAAQDAIEKAQTQDQSNTLTTAEQTDATDLLIQAAKDAINNVEETQKENLNNLLNKTELSNNLKKAIQEAKNYEESHPKTAEQLQAKINNAQQLLSNASAAQNEDLTSQVALLNKKLLNLQNNEKALKAIADANALEEQPTDQNIASLKDLIKQANDAKEAITAENQDYVDLLNPEIDELQTKLQTLIKQNKHNQVEQLVQKATEINAQNPNTSKNDKLTQAIENVKQAIVEANDLDIQNTFKTQIDDLENSLKAKKEIAKLETLVEDTQVFNNQLTNVEQKMMDVKIDEHKTALEQYLDGIVKQSAQKVVTDAISKETIAELENAISNARTQISKVKNTTDRNNLTEQLEQAKVKVQALKDDIDPQKNYQKALQEYNQAIADVLANSATDEANLNAHTQAINNFIAKIPHDSNTFEQQFNKLTSQLDAIKNAKDLITALEQLKQDNQFSNLTADQLEAKLAQITKAIDKIENNDVKNKLKQAIAINHEDLLVKKAQNAVQKAKDEAQKASPSLEQLSVEVQKATQAIEDLEKTNPNNSHLTQLKADLKIAQDKQTQLKQQQNQNQLNELFRNSVSDFLAYDLSAPIEENIEEYENQLAKVLANYKNSQYSSTFNLIVQMLPHGLAYQNVVELFKYQLEIRKAAKDLVDSAVIPFDVEQVEWKLNDLNVKIFQLDAKYMYISDVNADHSQYYKNEHARLSALITPLVEKQKALNNVNKLINDADTYAKSANEFNQITELENKIKAVQDAITNLANHTQEEKEQLNAKLNDAKDKLNKLKELKQKEEVLNDVESFVRLAESHNATFGTELISILEKDVKNARDNLDRIIDNPEKHNEFTKRLDVVQAHIELRKGVQTVKQYTLAPIDFNILEFKIQEQRNILESQEVVAPITNVLNEELDKYELILNKAKLDEEIAKLNNSLPEKTPADIEDLENTINKLRIKINTQIPKEDPEFNPYMNKLTDAQYKVMELKKLDKYNKAVAQIRKIFEQLKANDLAQLNPTVDQVKNNQDLLASADKLLEPYTNKAELRKEIEPTLDSFELKAKIQEAKDYEASDSKTYDGLNAKIAQAEQLINNANESQKTELQAQIDLLKQKANNLQIHENIAKIAFDARSIGDEPIIENQTQLESVIDKVEKLKQKLTQINPEYIQKADEILNNLNEKLENIKHGIQNIEKLEIAKKALKAAQDLNDSVIDDSQNQQTEEKINRAKVLINDLDDSDDKTNLQTQLTKLENELQVKKAIADLKVQKENEQFNTKLADTLAKLNDLEASEHKNQIAKTIDDIVNSQALGAVDKALQPENQDQIAKLEKLIEDAQQQINNIKDTANKANAIAKLQPAIDKLAELKDKADPIKNAEKAQQAYEKAIADILANEPLNEANIQTNKALINKYKDRLPEDDTNRAQISSWNNQLDQIKTVKDQLNELLNNKDLTSEQLVDKLAHINSLIDALDNQEVKDHLKTALTGQESLINNKKAQEAVAKANELAKEAQNSDELAKAIKNAQDAIAKADTELQNDLNNGLQPANDKKSLLDELIRAEQKALEPEIGSAELSKVASIPIAKIAKLENNQPLKARAQKLSDKITSIKQEEINQNIASYLIKQMKDVAYDDANINYQKLESLKKQAIDVIKDIKYTSKAEQFTKEVESYNNNLEARNAIAKFAKAFNDKVDTESLKSLAQDAINKTTPQEQKVLNKLLNNYQTPQIPDWLIIAILSLSGTILVLYLASLIIVSSKK